MTAHNILPTEFATYGANEVRQLASGNLALLAADGRKVLCILTPDAWYGTPDEWGDGPTCSICDGLGHGYPGGGPCPLEDRGYWDAEEERQRGGW